MKILGKFKIFFLLILFLCASCEKLGINKAELQEDLTNPIIDEELRLRKSDFFKELQKKDNNENLSFITKESDSLKLSNILVPPMPSMMGNGQLVSISVTEEVPLKDIFIELARLTDIDIQIDSDITSSIILKVTNKPLEVVVKNICETANLKYSYNNNILKIEKDTSYLKEYNVDILQESNLWDTLENSIQNILNIEQKKVNKALQKEADARYKAAMEEYTRKQTIISDVTNQTEAPERESIEEEQFTITINKPASLMSIFANEKGHKAVENYLNRTKENYGSQVLIEAKVIEVQLKDEFSAGINWSILGGNNSIQVGGAEESLTQGIKSLTLSGPLGGKNLNAIVTAMEQFGNTRTLSSPRISTLNNQPATLDFVKKLVYFSVETERDDDDYNNVTYNSERQEDEEGAKLQITPTINTKTRDIILKVKPEIRVQVGIVSDPNPDVINDVPVIQTRTLETSLKIRSGDIMVIGGLMGENMERIHGGVPLLQHIPFFGNLFRYRKKDRTVTETVIFIKATIVDNEEPLTKKDEEFYKKYFPND